MSADFLYIPAYVFTFIIGWHSSFSMSNEALKDSV